MPALLDPPTGLGLKGDDLFPREYEYYSSISPVEVEPPTSIMAPTIGQQVAAIRHAFSLTVTQAARVLAIERPTVYAWSKQSDPCDAGYSRHQRLMGIHELAQMWMAYGQGPMGDRALAPFSDTPRCMLDYLATGVLNEDTLREIRYRLDLLARSSDDSLVAAHQALDSREGFRKLGFQESTQEERDANFEDNLRRIRYEY
jgi:hypothetical protein